LEGSPRFADCPSGKSNTSIKISMQHRSNGSDRKNLKYSEKNLSSDPLSTVLTWTALGSNHGLRGDRPTTYRWSMARPKRL